MNLTRFLVLMIFSFAATALRAQDGQAPPSIKAPDTKGFKNVNVEEFDKLRADKKNVVLDVRTKREFEAGHIPGAVNIDVNAPDFDKKVAKLDKSKTYLVHCAGGVRSVKACEKLAPLKFENLYNLEGGYKA